MTAAAARLAERIEQATTVEECHAIATDLLRRVKAGKRARSRRRADRGQRAHGRMKPTKESMDSREAAGKAFARQRSGGQCEWYTDGKRCWAQATDGDHVLGGTHKAEMEALPNGEGFQDECRLHHELKHGANRRGALDQAKEHALRIGSKRLLRAVEKAIKVYEAKHTPSVPIRVVFPVSEEGGREP